MQSTARPAISARLIGFTGGRSRGEHTGFAIIAVTMPVPIGGLVEVSIFDLQALASRDF
jgi:hypothetical protein